MRAADNAQCTPFLDSLTAQKSRQDGATSNAHLDIGVNALVKAVHTAFRFVRRARPRVCLTESPTVEIFEQRDQARRAWVGDTIVKVLGLAPKLHEALVPHLG